MVATLVFLVAAVGINVFTYGGVGWIYLKDTNRVDPPRLEPPAPAPALPAPAEPARALG
ncbi:hypothetical protein HN031_18115 [Nocardioides sp. zg-1308]|uniref:Uncharacterized protein n=1 Tax=Nocardioides renjunii TaxID=3095075 RepID=A0ABU5KBA6_9ACTN|nr:MULTISPECIES: hypothetical protein [unclassified Nocardioides]MDZ5661704.1 hypothetical protein [Nocardioides sp. S-58]NPD06594.1 hypothetical protein [Nocardioides sp. zg-1308]WQQ23946.1 hypothetical protein SHK17_08140 [Nocardioides sp. S-34]